MRRFAFVDGMRGLVAVWIVVFHAFAGGHFTHLEAWLPSWRDRFVMIAPVGVTVFFVLSGFVIAYAVRERRFDVAYGSRFLMRRLLRLGPPYWVSLLLAVAVAPWLPDLHPTTAGSSPTSSTCRISCTSPR